MEILGKFVKEAHFGGDFFTRKANSSDPDQHKSRKELLDEMIASSKQYKYNQMKDKEDTVTLNKGIDSIHV